MCSLVSFAPTGKEFSLADFNLYLNHELKDRFIAVRVGDHCAHLLHRRLGIAGSAFLPGTLVVSRIFEKSEIPFIENRVGGASWLLSRGNSWIGLLVDSGATVSATPDGAFAPQKMPTEPAVILLDATQAIETALTPYLPRQSVGLVGLRLHYLASGWSWKAGSATGP